MDVAEDHHIRLFLFSPVQQTAPVIVPDVPVAVGHGQGEPQLLCHQFRRSPVFIAVTVAAYCIHRNAGDFFDIRGILAVVTGVEPQIHFPRLVQYLFQGLEISMGVTDHADSYRFIFFH